MDPEEVVLQAREPDGVPTFIGALFFSSLVSSLLIGWHFGSGPDGVRHLGTMLVFFLASALTHSLCGLPFVAVLFWMLRGKYRRIEAGPAGRGGWR